PYGVTSGGGFTRYGFTGRELDSQSGLMFYRARYYDPAIGRFISEDPLGLGGGDSNYYAYVHNSPTNLVDPSGLIGAYESAGQIHIGVSILIYGPNASDELAARWEEALIEFWNSPQHHSGKCTVFFDFTISADPNHNFFFTARGRIRDFGHNAYTSDADLKAYVEESSDYRSWVSGGRGHWSKGDIRAIFHEVGHILGLPDRYRDYWHGWRVPIGFGDTSEPLPGMENDIMATLSGLVTDQDVSDILAQHGWRCSCK
ncbi:MAG TPA: RHS repeat-associated core domain-containing protein, partial [Blastocatellia bacterium]|nr:RHS repeat-associated core domain-containing protein [Blastocatellia bacterium]